MPSAPPLTMSLPLLLTSLPHHYLCRCHHRQHQNVRNDVNPFLFAHIITFISTPMYGPFSPSLCEITKSHSEKIPMAAEQNLVVVARSWGVQLTDMDGDRLPMSLVKERGGPNWLT